MSEKPNEGNALEWSKNSEYTQSSWDPKGATSSNGSASLSKVRSEITDVFDQRIWYAVEAGLSVYATLLIDGVQQCSGLLLVGPSGAGKTTALRFFENASIHGDELTYRSDDTTPAAFVSHDSSRDEDELAETDLLPKIKHKMLLNPDMASWFSGERESISKRMSYVAQIMDGRGFTRDTGSHGSRGYEGDYRFALLGATTPLQSRAWDVMGKVGNRLVFIEVPAENDLDEVVSDVFGDEEYRPKVERCQEAVNEFMESLWADRGGYAGISWGNKANNEVRERIKYLAQLISYARAPIVKGSDNTPMPQAEDPHRIMAILRNIARGRALIEGREELRMDDLDVCARIALSTMHRERRGIVRAVVDPETMMPCGASELESHAEISSSRKTILKRMEMLQTLGMGDVLEGDSGRGTQEFMLYSQFQWPDHLPYPEFE